MQRGRGRLIGAMLAVGLALLLFGVGQGFGRTLRGKLPLGALPGAAPLPLPTVVAPAAGLIPRLSAPEGVRLAGGENADRAGAVASEAMAETELPTAELERQFAAQLAAAGWSRLDGGTGATLAWSTWALPVPAGARGVLLVSEGAEPGRRWLYVRVDGPGVP